MEKKKGILREFGSSQPSITCHTSLQTLSSQVTKIHHLLLDPVLTDCARRQSEEAQP